MLARRPVRVAQARDTWVRELALPRSPDSGSLVFGSPELCVSPPYHDGSASWGDYTMDDPCEANAVCKNNSEKLGQR